VLSSLHSPSANPPLPTFLYFFQTPQQFLGAAVVEVLLSTDNICLFHQIFEHFKIPREVGGCVQLASSATHKLERRLVSTLEPIK
jgi:hypothetical protein